MYQTILVPLDGSERAEAILPHVIDLARRYKATVLVLRVVDPDQIAERLAEPDAPLTEKLLASLEEEARQYLLQVQTRLNEQGVVAQPVVARGAVVKAIARTATAREVDLVALASHGRTGLSRAFYGSVAAGVLHRVDRPLLLIRTGYAGAAGVGSA